MVINLLTCSLELPAQAAINYRISCMGKSLWLSLHTSMLTISDGRVFVFFPINIAAVCSGLDTPAWDSKLAGLLAERG